MAKSSTNQGSVILNKLSETKQSVSIVFGNTVMPIESALTALPGTLIELFQENEEPFNVLVNDKLCFRGEVVEIEDTYGIRITEIVEE